jgi:hypothetical protein
MTAVASHGTAQGETYRSETGSADISAAEQHTAEMMAVGPVLGLGEHTDNGGAFDTSDAR